MDAQKNDRTSLADEETPSDGSRASRDVTPRRGRRRGYALLAATLAVLLAVPVVLELRDAPAESLPSRADEKPPAPLDADEAQRRARASGKDVEATALRTANSTTWAQPDGYLRTRTHSDTIRAKADGEWKPIDTTLRHVKGGYAPTAVNDALLFSDGTGDERSSRAAERATLRAPGAKSDGPWSELVRMTADGHDLVVSWPGPLPEPVVEGPRALYENVRPGIDLLLTARDSGYSHVLIVKNREAASDPLLDELDYRLSSPDLTFKLIEGPDTVSAVDRDGQEMAAAPTPYMWDSAGQVKATIGEDTGTASASPRPAGALALPGLAGPQPGSHTGALQATLSQDDTLRLSGSDRLLSDDDTVYPVFIDPSFKGRKKNWTLLYKTAPSSSFWNGQNFNDGTNEARIGYESTTGGTSRSVFTFDYGSGLHGASVKSAYFRALQTYSWGCSSRRYDLYKTGAISSSTTWSTPLSWGSPIASLTNGYGYNSSSCPDKWVALDIKTEAQQASSSKLTSMTLGLRAYSESDANYWKKFMANGESSPFIEVVYNRVPNEPSGAYMKLTPGGLCDTVSPYPGIGKTDLTFTATGSDPDGNLKYIDLGVWPTGDSAHPVLRGNYAPNSSGTINVTVPWSKFTHGKTYTWTARTIDTDGATSAWGPTGTTAYCQFTVDQTAPNSPGVSSVAFPPPGEDGSTWSTVRFGTPGTFTFTPNGSTDVKEYQYSFDTAFDQRAYPVADPDPAKNGAATTPPLKPPHAGPSVLYVRTADANGNVSPPAKYLFYVTPGTNLDSPGDVTGDQTPDVYTVNADGNLDLYAKTAGSDRFHFPMPAGYTTVDGAAEPLPDGYWTGALITHNGDWLPGDGIQDLVARMPDGKLYVYPGDGYGGFDAAERREVLLPAPSPDPGTFRQIVSTGDITGDGRPDLLATSGGSLWAFTGYTGASFAKATLLSGEDWTHRDLVQVGSIAGDSTPDLVFRENSVGQLHLRYGKAATSGGVDLASFATKGGAAGQLDTYGASGWSRTALPIVTGTPDVDGDGLPDIWALFANGDVRVYPGRTTGLSSVGAFYVVTSTVGTTWSGHTAIG